MLILGRGGKRIGHMSQFEFPGGHWGNNCEMLPESGQGVWLMFASCRSKGCSSAVAHCKSHPRDVKAHAQRQAIY